jgi:hypothetical protein
MKSLRQHLTRAIFLGAVAAIPGCDVPTAGEPVDGTMNANIVGSSEPWEAEKSLSATMALGKLIIKGVDSSTAAITLTIYNPAVGAFTAGGGEPLPSVEATYGDDRFFSYTSLKPGGGMVTLTITELTATTAVGTFAFVAMPIFNDLQGSDLYRVQNGTFNVTIR